jgi:lactoylglutathione lyase
MRRLLVVALALGVLAPLRAGGQPATPAVGRPEAPKLAYVMVFTADMKRSVAFYRDDLGLKMRFTSPAWSEFDTGQTVLALHPAGPNHPAGTAAVGITVRDLDAFYAARKAAGATFTGPPEKQPYGSPLTELRDPDGALVSVGGP